MTLQPEGDKASRLKIGVPPLHVRSNHCVFCAPPMELGQKAMDECGPSRIETCLPSASPDAMRIHHSVWSALEAMADSANAP